MVSLSSPITFAVPIPNVPKVAIPTKVLIPETLNEVRDPIPPITLVAVTAVATLNSLSTLPSNVNAVVAKDAVDAVPVKFPTKVGAVILSSVKLILSPTAKSCPFPICVLPILIG